MKTDAINRAIQVFRKHGGVLRTSEAVSYGIHPRTLYALRDDGIIQAVSRGLYCLSDHTLLNQPDLVAAALRVPKGVVCLTSALAFHDITTQVPHEVSMAIPRRMRSPVIDYPPMRFHRFSDASYAAGIEKHTVEGVDMRMYSPEKTVADCFKFRHKIGLGVATEALRFCRERKKSSPQQLLHYARICRVEAVMTPYLKAEYFLGNALVPKPLDYSLLLEKRPIHAPTTRVAEAAARYAEARKRIIIIAGPNGAGKTTFAREFLPQEAACPAFVNADYIAAGLSPFHPNAAAIKAGRLMVNEIGEYVRRGNSFAFETTLTGRRYARVIPQWQAEGYGVKLIFLRLRNVELAIRRVAIRVAQGGHDVPEATIRRRYSAGWKNFNTMYKPMVDAWAVYDCSGPRPKLIEEGENE